MMQTYNTVEEYISAFPEGVQDQLNDIRTAVKQAAPQAIESISYGMPAYKLNKKPLCYFGAFKTHIGFFATPQGHSQFKEELSKYKQGKGSVQFPQDRPMPLELIKKIVAFKVITNKQH